MDLYARVAMDTGMTWEEVGRLTLPRYRAIYCYLQKHPPVQWMVAAWLGIAGEDGGSGGGSGDGYVDINDIDLPPGGLRMGG